MNHLRIHEFCLNAFFPRFCVACKTEGSLWCASCAQTWSFRPLTPACAFCHKPGSNATCFSCRTHAYLDGVMAFGPYANPTIRSLLHQWKYIGDQSAEPILQQWLFQDADRLRPPLFPFVLTPVPLHIARKRFRGFDQAAHLARWIEQMYGLPIEPLLTRTVHTPSQAQVQGRTRQMGELDEIFSLCPYVDPHHLPTYVLLCDDVFTSGATMDAAARVLKQAGVKSVWGFVIAKGA